MKDFSVSCVSVKIYLNFKDFNISIFSIFVISTFIIKVRVTMTNKRIIKEFNSVEDDDDQ